MLSELELSDISRRAPNLDAISIDINYTLNGSLVGPFSRSPTVAVRSKIYISRNIQ